MGLHLQHDVDGYPEIVQYLPSGAMVKSVDNMGLLVNARNVRDDIIGVYRKWLPHEQQIGESTWEAALGRANWFFSQFVDNYMRENAQAVQAIETYNEVITHLLSAEDLRRQLLQERAFAEIWEQFKRDDHRLAHIKLIHANVPIGNNVPRELAQIAVEYGNWVGYHPYSLYVNGSRDPGDWKYLSGRWNTQEVDEWGSQIKPVWAFTEAGLFHNAELGWRHEQVANGDLNRYVEGMRQWIRDVKQTAAYQEGRIMNYAVFTTNIPAQGWEWYRTNPPELNALVEMEAQEWTQVEPPPPPPPPPPSGTEHTGIDVSRWQETMDWNKAKSAGAVFAIARATIGATGVDDQWEANKAGIVATGLLPGAYHYFKDNRDPVTQARHFASHVPDGFIAVADIEDKYAGPDVAANVLTFLSELERLIGVRPVIYTGAWWWNPYIGNVSWASDYPLWVANYTTASDPLLPSAWSTWDIWQYTSSGPGYDYGAGSARIDLNRFRGDISAWWQTYARGAVSPPPPVPTPSKYEVRPFVLNLRDAPGGTDIGDTYAGAVWEGTGNKDGDWIEVKAWFHGDYVTEIQS